jgi:hypothetical protein
LFTIALPNHHRRRSAAVEIERVLKLETLAEALQLGERHADAVIRLTAVDRREPERALAIETDERPRMPDVR